MVFADTNIVVYAYGVDPTKVAKAKAILNDAPVISTQVINEFHNVARRKLGLDIATRHRIATDLLQSCRVVAVDQAIVAAAMQVEARYQVSYWDALIIAAALAAGCSTLYSEDMQDGQVFEGRLTVKNPFAGS
ncbi:MAG: PIN domain-containing protein [Rhodocyclaceae bacterium]|nr:PIN domain-containing protein [Rhodocyclaceae bacterium]MDZ4213731.1 PIN domain-containing protein [Rhodocyclaceae bacterium]